MAYCGRLEHSCTQTCQCVLEAPETAATESRQAASAAGEEGEGEDGNQGEGEEEGRDCSKVSLIGSTLEGLI